METILQALARDLEKRGGLDVKACFIDSTFVVAKKGQWGGKDQARQTHEAHGSGRPRWSSNRRLRHKR